eukprot:1158721-Pelagomonas_calceolata.AAC.1
MGFANVHALALQEASNQVLDFLNAEASVKAQHVGTLRYVSWTALAFTRVCIPLLVSPCNVMVRLPSPATASHCL